MRVVGVIDVREGLAVHARGGRREAYAPIGVAACVPVDGNAVALARVYVEQLGVRELYVADLDAIAGGMSALNAPVVERIASLGVPMFVDAGATSAEDARAVVGVGATTVVVGLETLSGFDALAGICEAVGGRRVAFSVDLRDGRPLVVPNVGNAVWPVTDIVRRAVSAGAGTIIVLDLARVGTGAGIDADLIASVRRAAGEAPVFAGGGVRGEEDLQRLEEVGCDGVLVATALLTGGIRV